MSTPLRLDFVADISCPWCALGLVALRQALERLPPKLEVELVLQPFELNPVLEAGGRDLAEYLNELYDSTAAQQAQAHATLQARGHELGFDFSASEPRRIYNTFNAHRLLRWVATEHPERQLNLMMALLTACHQQGQPMDADDVLLTALETAGLDRERGMDVLADNAYADDVRQQEALFHEAGIRSVPTLIVNNRYLLSGAQPVDVLEQALQQIAAETDD